MKKKIEIFITLGPSTLNKIFLKKIKKSVNLLRLNLSHVELKNLASTIKFIKKYSNVPICIDTEGAQIRTKISKVLKFKKKQQGKIFRNKGNFNLYPSDIFFKLRVGDILDIGFDNLKIKITKKDKDYLVFKTISGGKLENNKGVHCINRKINLNYLTDKDFKAIKIAKSFNIDNFALSFTRSHQDIIKFNSLLKNSRKIFKLEIKNAIQNLNKIFKYGKDFLIDRGDLSKETSVEKIPIYQRHIMFKAKKNRKNIFVATNCLESMISNPYPTRAESNDIYNILELDAKGLVLAAETAIGKYPVESIFFLKKMIKIFQKKASI